MALNLRCIGNILNGVKNIHYAKPLCSSLQSLQGQRSSLLLVENIEFTSVRSTGSFFNKYSSDFLWKGVTSVSNAGAKKGRASRVRRMIDFNRGQIIGRGKVQVEFPGLNTNVYNKQGDPISIRQKEGEDTMREERLKEARERQMARSSRKRMKLDPLDRGWSGTKWPGRSIGPPDPIHGESFEGFDTIVLEQKRVHHMTRQGRIQRFSIFAVTGNKNGMVGFGLGKAMKLHDATKIARNRAGQNLVYIERYDDHTVFHDFWTQFVRSKIYVQKQPEGFGLEGHRVIIEICKCIGIKNLRTECEGAVSNAQNITKSFILGLLRQKSYQALANEKKLYLIEKKEECLNFPKIVAVPNNGPVREASEIPNDEELDFKLVTLDGKVPLVRPRYEPPYTKLYSFGIHLKHLRNRRNREKTWIQLLADHGDPNKFYTEAYKDHIPEMKPRRPN